MRSILISPYSARLINNAPNPKNYPYWEALIRRIKIFYHDVKITQVGTEGEQLLKGIDGYLFNLPFDKLEDLIKNSVLWMSVDNFFPHFCNAFNVKTKGIVIFGQSDPVLFGYKQNDNLLKHKQYLRAIQYRSWMEDPFNAEVFLSDEEVFKIVRKYL